MSNWPDAFRSVCLVAIICYTILRLYGGSLY